MAESEFVGIDLSAAAIEEGHDFVLRMGLTNIVLRCHDIMEFNANGEAFDYIIAHGVYSWVPAAVREKMLSIFRENLSPHGIAFVSYNCYPGCHSRDIARQIMRHHVREVADPRERALQARAVLRFLAEASAENTIYGFEIRNQLDRINGIMMQAFQMICPSSGMHSSPPGGRSRVAPWAAILSDAAFASDLTTFRAGARQASRSPFG